ncbi:MAG: crossover junction endodeoxyribonuclease RuvC, partial [candidate division NC10 bacterium]
PRGRATPPEAAPRAPASASTSRSRIIQVSLRVLGVDPGLVATGYGLIEPGPGGVAVLARGVIATGADLPLEARIHAIYDGVDRLLAGHAPSVLVLEDLYAEYRFPRTALLMAHARGVICLAARQRDVTLLALAPAEVKRAIAANGAASKEQVQRSVQRMLRLEAPPRPSHVADALALALTGLSRLGGRIS